MFLREVANISLLKKLEAKTLKGTTPPYMEERENEGGLGKLGAEHSSKILRLLWTS